MHTLTSLLMWLVLFAYGLILVIKLMIQWMKSYLINLSKTVIRIPSCDLKESNNDDYHKNDNSDKHDAVIIGGGVVGSAMALCLAKQNRRVAVIERALGDKVDTKKIIGELMQPSGIFMLHKLGLDHLLEDFEKAKINGYTIHVSESETICEYPRDENGELISGFGFHNHLFVQSLRDEMKRYKNIEVYEATVNEIMRNENGIAEGVIFTRRNSEEKEKFEADVVFVADGCFSAFREPANKKDIVVSGYFLGMCLKNCNIGENTQAHLFLANPSCILLYPIGDQEYRILIDSKTPIQKSNLNDEFFENIRTYLPQEAHESFTEAVKLKEYRVMPNQILPSRDYRFMGAVFLGDSFNMRHPISGAGMTVGLTDVYLLAKAFENMKDFKDESVLDKKMEIFFHQRHQENMMLNILACALYEVMDFDNSEMAHAFFQYISKEGHQKKGPMRLISGLSRNENELLVHFFSVVLEASKKHLKGMPTPKKLLSFYRLMRKGLHIFMRHRENEKPSLTSGLLSVAKRTVFLVDL